MIIPYYKNENNLMINHMTTISQTVNLPGKAAPLTAEVDPRSAPCRQGAALSAEIFGWSHAAAPWRHHGDVMVKDGQWLSHGLIKM